MRLDVRLSLLLERYHAVETGAIGAEDVEFDFLFDFLPLGDLTDADRSGVAQAFHHLDHATEKITNRAKVVPIMSPQSSPKHSRSSDTNVVEAGFDGIGRSLVPILM